MNVGCCLRVDRSFRVPWQAAHVVQSFLITPWQNEATSYTYVQCEIADHIWLLH